MATKTTPTSMSMKPGIGLPSRKPTPQKAESRTHVEAEKLDPSVFGLKKKSPEQELLDNAEPMDFSPKPVPKPAQAEPAPPPEPEPEEEKKEYLDEAVDDNLIERLVEEYGFEPAKVYQAKLPIPGTKKVLKVGYRPMNWDDYSWALAAVQRRETEENKIGNSWSDAQRAQMYQALTACRCVVSLAGTPVWDLFDARQEIKAVKPSWNGESHIGIPDFFLGSFAQKTFELFRKKLHPDLLFALDEAVREKDEESEEDNPTEAT